MELNNERTLTIIPKKTLEEKRIEESRKVRVAAYARVSTDEEDQINSFNAQKEEYERRIKENPEWEFVKLYSDEGITGTSKEKRKGFMEMINDALGGKIDLILVKSISRFARNTVDCIKTYRDLKNKGVAIYFDKEHINSLEKDVEFQLTLYASMAQEESHNISTNVTWGVRSRMRRGERKMNVKFTLGYDYDESGKIVINEEEASLVVHIFTQYINGFSISEIVKQLNKSKTPKKCSNEPWNYTNVKNLLTDEKYIGTFVMQKTVVLDYLDHRSYVNNGYENKYIIENHHKPIIEKVNFDLVQMIINKESKGKAKNNPYPLFNMMYCASCFKVMGRINNHPNTKYQRQVMTCRITNKNSVYYKKCSINAGTIDYELAIKGINDFILKFYLKNFDFVGFSQKIYSKNKDRLIEEKNQINDKLTATKNELNNLIQLSVSSSVDYSKEYDALNKQINILSNKISEIDQEILTLRGLTVLSDIKDDEDKEIDIPNRLIRNLFKLIIRKTDNTLLFVHGTDTRNIDENFIKRCLLVNPFYKGSVSNDSFKLKYEVIKLSEVE